MSRSAMHRVRPKTPQTISHWVATIVRFGEKKAFFGFVEPKSALLLGEIQYE